jgi:hypothetical protein
MQAAAARTREHQVVLCGLEVLRLMGERMADSSEVDPQDLQIVFDFMRDVAHRCLDNTEEILRFASMDQHVTRHHQAKLLFEELIQSDERTFVPTCRRYTDLLADSIFDDRRCVATLDCDAVTLSQFYEWEHEINEKARHHGQVLHRLEVKYTAPHCI